MNLVYASSLTVLFAFLGGGVSAWCEFRSQGGAHSGESTASAPLTTRWDAGWHTSLSSASEVARSSDRPILVYTRLDLPFLREFEDRAGTDAPLADAFSAFVPVVLDLTGPGNEDAAALGLHSAPLFVRLDPEDDGSLRVTRAAETLTGALFEPIGLAHELAGLARDDPGTAGDVFEEVRQLDALGRYDEADARFDAALAEERAPNGPLHRMALLREAVHAHAVTDVVDARGAIQEHLEVESDRRVLYRGWTTLASSYATYRMSRDTPRTRGARDRLLRRLLDATRLGYKYAPESVLAPYAALLLQRYALEIGELDTMDKMFARVVTGVLRKAAPDSPRLDLTAPFENR